MCLQNVIIFTNFSNRFLYQFYSNWCLVFQYEQSIYYFIIIAQLRDSIYLHYTYTENYFTKKEKKRIVNFTLQQ